jgi:hypothetical protein
MPCMPPYLEAVRHVLVGVRVVEGDVHDKVEELLGAAQTPEQRTNATAAAAAPQPNSEWSTSTPATVMRRPRHHDTTTPRHRFEGQALAAINAAGPCLVVGRDLTKVEALDLTVGRHIHHSDVNHSAAVSAQCRGGEDG